MTTDFENVSVYGDFFPGSGPTTASMATSPFGYRDETTNAQAAARGTGDSLDKAIAVGASGSAVAWWVALALIYVAITWLAEKAGEGHEYSSIRLSATNVLIIALASILGTTLLKTFFTKVKPIPGLTSVILAA